MRIFEKESNRPLPVVHKAADGIYVSQNTTLTLPEYISARYEHCASTHAQPCTTCTALLKVAEEIIRNGYCLLSSAFSTVSLPTVMYTAERARRKLLQMPLVTVCIGNPTAGTSFTVVIERVPGVDYAKITRLIHGVLGHVKPQTVTSGLDKVCVKLLLSLAQSDRERQCLRYAVVKASGVTPTQARKRFGFQNASVLCSEVEKCVQESQCIREAVEDLAHIQDKALLATLGIEDDDNSTDSEGEEEGETSQYLEPVQTNPEPYLTPTIRSIVENNSTLVQALQDSGLNWFEFRERIEQEMCEVPPEALNSLLDRIVNCFSTLGLSQHDLDLVTQSYESFQASVEDCDEERIARALNGEVVSDSDSDNPDAYIGLEDPLRSEAGRQLVCKRRAAIQRRARRLRAKLVSQQRYLARKQSKRMSKIMNECPDIGKTIETFVEERNVGADAWRRTGVLTFDGNVNLKEKVTYKRIQQHLCKVYNRHFSYGTVIELCVPRNKRRRSAKRYRGVAKVTTRRARKGFALRYNPDAHWSAAMYKGLNELQYKDGRMLLMMNRDDASGFRLDTLTTSKQYANPVVRGNDILTTRTDFVNKYPSSLQTTSYNFTATDTTSEVCVGIVKASGVHFKNPAQHFSDLEMLEEKEELRSVFTWEGTPKPIDCARVDGATDEGPAHEEVQFWWTERHLSRRKVATLLTSRSSGSSFLNRVELQNGCLSLGHSNTFIPSTLGGSCYNPDTGSLDQDRLKNNMELAMDAYISRVDGCPCGDTVIQLYKGAISDIQAKREKLLIFLKGSKAQKKALQQEDPHAYSYFSVVWDVRNRHIVPNLPVQYIFFLTCCFSRDCPHPVCQAGEQSTPLKWYSNGPPITHLLLPVPDPERPWGKTDCTSCTGFCTGHYKTKLIDVRTQGAGDNVAQPPSTLLKRLYSRQTGQELTDQFVRTAAKQVQLSPEETQIWLSHLQTVLENRRRGAAKAKATRQARKAASQQVISQSSTQLATVQTSSRQVASPPPTCTQPAAAEENEQWFCGCCREEYVDETESSQLWIACDLCQNWYHCSCEGLDKVPESDQDYVCTQCTR